MDRCLVLLAVGQAVTAPFVEIPHPIQEPLAALYRIIGPGSSFFKVADKHDIQPHGIRAIAPDHVVRVDHIAQGLGHFHRGPQSLVSILLNQGILLLLGGDITHIVGILAQDHAVAGTFMIGLCVRHYADVIEEVVPEPAVEKV